MLLHTLLLLQHITAFTIYHTNEFVGEAFEAESDAGFWEQLVCFNNDCRCLWGVAVQLMELNCLLLALCELSVVHRILLFLYCQQIIANKDKSQSFRSKLSFDSSSLTWFDPFVWSVVLEPLNDTVSSSFSSEINWWLRFVLTPELKSWESFNIDDWDFVFSWIDFSDDNVGVVGKSFGSFVEVWGDGLAVSAPWGVELNQDFFFIVEDNIFEGLSNDNFDWGIVWLWDFCRFQESFGFTGLNSFDEWTKVFGSDFILIVEVFVVVGTKVEEGWWVSSVDA